jgi:hypothetical protein
MTFEDLQRIDPRLRELAVDICRVKDAGPYGFCANYVWGREFKPRMVDLVGWDATDPRLTSSEAYNVAYAYLYDLLPGCRECGCISLEYYLDSIRRSRA